MCVCWVCMMVAVSVSNWISTFQVECLHMFVWRLRDPCSMHSHYFLIGSGSDWNAYTSHTHPIALVLKQLCVASRLTTLKVAAPFMRSRYLCGCIMLINWISTEAVKCLLLWVCIHVTYPMHSRCIHFSIVGHDVAQAVEHSAVKDWVPMSGGSILHGRCILQFGLFSVPQLVHRRLWYVLSRLWESA